MEYLIVACAVAPLAIVVLVLLACWFLHPNRICRSMSRQFRSIARDNRGQDLVEYMLMAFFVAVVIVAIIPDLATSINHILAKFPAIDGDTLAGSVRAREISVDAGMWIRGICGVAALATLAAIVLRRRKNPKDY